MKKLFVHFSLEIVTGLACSKHTLSSDQDALCRTWLEGDTMVLSLFKQPRGLSKICEVEARSDIR
jgi:hypothetical protein